MSAVWKYFKLETPQCKTAKCNVCKAVIQRGRSSLAAYNTTNAIKHLKKHHVKEHKDFFARGQKDQRSRQESLVEWRNCSTSSYSMTNRYQWWKMWDFTAWLNTCSRRIVYHPGDTLRDCATWNIQPSLNQVSWEVKRSSIPELYYRYLDFRCLPNVILACREECKQLHDESFFYLVVIAKKTTWFGRFKSLVLGPNWDLCLFLSMFPGQASSCSKQSETHQLLLHTETHMLLHSSHRRPIKTESIFHLETVKINNP